MLLEKIREGIIGHAVVLALAGSGRFATSAGPAVGAAVSVAIGASAGIG